MTSIAGTVHAEVACTPDVVDGQVVGFAVAVTVLPAPRSAMTRAGLRSRVRALVVDDDPLARAGLGAILRSGPGIEVAGEVATAEEALATFGRPAPTSS